jgi:hypothetical protein
MPQGVKTWLLSAEAWIISQQALADSASLTGMQIFLVFEGM